MSATSILATATLLKSGAPARTLAVRWAPFDWRTYAQYFARPALRPLLLQFLFFMLSFSTFISGFALFAERRFEWNGRPFGPREIGYVFGFVGFLGIILQGLLIGRLVKRFGEVTLAAAGFAALVLGYLTLGLATAISLLVIVAVVSGFGNGVLRPSLTSLITHQAGAARAGRRAGDHAVALIDRGDCSPDRRRPADRAPDAHRIGPGSRRQWRRSDCSCGPPRRGGDAARRGLKPAPRYRSL